jgi:hypothetical protein
MMRIRMSRWAITLGTLRLLTSCEGNPAVLVLCHPVKSAAKDNLLPRGGGAFLNEVDANLTLWAEVQGETSTLHWQGKIRGADFRPVNLSLKQVKPDKLRDGIVTVTGSGSWPGGG